MKLLGIRKWVPRAFAVFGYSPFANLTETEVSTKPPNWSGKKEQISQVKGAPLKRRNLRYAQADGAFLVNADLSWADLRGANLSDANLQGANLLGANLEGALLFGADLQGAILRVANLQGAYLFAAKLEGAFLEGADLREALLLTAEQLSKVETLYEAKLDVLLMEHIKKEYPHLLEMPKFYE